MTASSAEFTGLVEFTPRFAPRGQISHVLFDFDGTLADSYPAITASVNHVRAFHGLEPLPECAMMLR